MSAKFATVAVLSLYGSDASHLPPRVRLTRERAGGTKEEWLVDAPKLPRVLAEIDEAPEVLTHLATITQVIERLAGACALASFAVICDPPG